MNGLILIAGIVAMLVGIIAVVVLWVLQRRPTSVSARSFWSPALTTSLVVTGVGAVLIVWFVVGAMTMDSIVDTAAIVHV